jgi:hypothetical protein
MSIASISQFKYTNDWEYETSEDYSLGIIGTYSTGTIILHRISNPDEKMRIKYRALVASLSKGLPIGQSQSQFTDDGGGYGPVASNRYFDDSCFPCKGYILGIGATFGAAGDIAAKIMNRPPPSGTNGAGLSVFYFGVWPFAGFRCYGSYTATTPGAGFSAALAGFEIAD